MSEHVRIIIDGDIEHVHWALSLALKERGFIGQCKMGHGFGYWTSNYTANAFLRRIKGGVSVHVRTETPRTDGVSPHSGDDQAEKIERLEAALRPFAFQSLYPPDPVTRFDGETKVDVHWPTTRRAGKPVGWFYIEDVRRARAALTEGTM